MPESGVLVIMGPRWDEVADQRNQEDIGDYHENYDEPIYDPYGRPDDKERFDIDQEDEDPATKPAPNPWWSTPEQGRRWGEGPDHRTGFGTGKAYRGSTRTETPFQVNERWKEVAKKYDHIKHPGKHLRSKIDKELKDRGLTWTQRKKVFDHHGWH